MSSPQGTLRQRGEVSKKKSATDLKVTSDQTAITAKKVPAGPASEWDYKLGFTIITILAFVSRFWGISHPDQVVFDEVHFGKVSHCCFHLPMSWLS